MTIIVYTISKVSKVSNGISVNKGFLNSLYESNTLSILTNLTNNLDSLGI